MNWSPENISKYKKFNDKHKELVMSILDTLSFQGLTSKAVYYMSCLLVNMPNPDTDLSKAKKAVATLTIRGIQPIKGNWNSIEWNLEKWKERLLNNFLVSLLQQLHWAPNQLHF